MAPTLRLASSRRGRPRRQSAEREKFFPVLRGLTLLRRLDPYTFGHEVRNLSFMLRSAAVRAKQARWADEASCREAVELAEVLWRLHPPEPDPHPLKRDD